MHTSSAVCLKRDSDVIFNEEEIFVSAADNCNRLQVCVDWKWMADKLLLANIQIMFKGIIALHYSKNFVHQVRDGRKGLVLFQSEEKSSRIRCTCICRQLSTVALGQENGTVQVLHTLYSISPSVFAFLLLHLLLFLLCVSSTLLLTVSLWSYILKDPTEQMNTVIMILATPPPWPMYLCVTNYDRTVSHK